ncbi:hypothetical protein DFH11DRAFT_590173 [Phellopilus nigrolimitatus]|nr:hypothetical protein DFH11DRAFT_590173 [Phellopilus nigrolimitatus]
MHSSLCTCIRRMHLVYILSPPRLGPSSQHRRKKALKIKGETTADEKQPRTDGNILKRTILGNRDNWNASRRTSTYKCRPAVPASSLVPYPPRRRRSQPEEKIHPSSQEPSGTAAESMAESSSLHQPHQQESELSTDMPSRRGFDPVIAYMWFHTVRRAVRDHGRADYKLEPNCSPYELAIMLVLGWVALEECVAWQDGRTTLGKGLVTLATTTHVLLQLEGLKRPSEQTVKSEGEVFMDILRASSTSAYDWDSDAADRTRYGPFGSALAPYADATTLEEILSQLADPKVCNDSIFLPNGLMTILGPLRTCHVYSRSEERYEEDTSSVTQSVQDEGDLDPTLVCLETAGDAKDKDEGHLLPANTSSEIICFEPSETLAQDIASPGVSISSTLFNEDSPSPSNSSSVESSPLIKVQCQLSTTTPFKGDLHASPDSERSNDCQAPPQDSEMELDGVDQFVATSRMPEDEEIDLDAIPFVYCVEQDAEMLPAEAEGEPDIALMIIDAINPPLPRLPSSFFIEANINVAMSDMEMDACSVDEEMQVLSTPLPLIENGHRALQRTESIIMDLEPSTPQTDVTPRALERTQSIVMDLAPSVFQHSESGTMDLEPPSTAETGPSGIEVDSQVVEPLFPKIVFLPETPQKKTDPGTHDWKPNTRVGYADEDETTPYVPTAASSPNPFAPEKTPSKKPLDKQTQKTLSALSVLLGLSKDDDDERQQRVSRDDLPHVAGSSRALSGPRMGTLNLTRTKSF